MRVTRVLYALMSLLPLALRAQTRDQVRQPDMVPLALAVALASSNFWWGENEPVITSGNVPEWVVERGIVPRAARILGAASSDRTTVAIVKMLGSRDSVLKRVDRELASRGWTEPPHARYFSGGFRPAPGRNPALGNRCRGNEQVWVSAMPERRDSTTVVLRLSGTEHETSVCRSSAEINRQRERSLPTLYDPDVPRAPSRCYTMSSGGQGTHTRLRTPMTSDELLMHYARQLQDSGWTPVRSPVSTVSGTWSRKDGDEDVLVTVTVAPVISDSLCREVRLDTRRYQDR